MTSGGELIFGIFEAYLSTAAEDGPKGEFPEDQSSDESSEVLTAPVSGPIARQTLSSS